MSGLPASGGGGDGGRRTGRTGDRRTAARSAEARNRRKRRRIRAAIVLVVGLVVVFAVLNLGGALWTILTGVRTDLVHAVPVPKPGQHVNLLFLGLDVVIKADGTVDLDTPLRSSRSRTDTMILFSVNQDTHETAVISIPRDTRVMIQGHGWQKINAAHVFGGPEMAMQVVEQLLGIPIHYYVRTNYAGVQAIVDAVGGVELNVDMDMKYDDPYQNLHIDLQKGVQVLDGEHALQYLRYRSDGGDIKRISRQQKFIGALINKVVSFSTVFKAQSLANQVVKYIDTNMGATDMWKFVSVAAKITDPALEMVTLPGAAQDIQDEGQPKLSYWVLDEQGAADIVDRLVWEIDRTANAGITVRVLNGCGVQGAATQMADRLRKDGFQVVEVGNSASQDETQTYVVAHKNDSVASDRVARSVLRYTPDAEVVRELLKEPPCDVTVIVGKDFSLSQR